MTLRFPQERHELLQAVRVRQQTEEFKNIYHRRAGIEGPSRKRPVTRAYGDLVLLVWGKTHLQHLLSAVATNILRFVQWRTGTRLCENSDLAFCRSSRLMGSSPTVSNSR